MFCVCLCSDLLVWFVCVVDWSCGFVWMGCLIVLLLTFLYLVVGGVFVMVYWLCCVLILLGGGFSGAFAG